MVSIIITTTESSNLSKRANKQKRDSRGKQVVDFKKANQAPKVRFSKPKHVDLIPRNLSQEKYIDDLANKRITVGLGEAGTGKSFLASMHAVNLLRTGEIKRIVVTRPAICSSQEMGYLPGTEVEKLRPLLRPLFDAVLEAGYSNEELEEMILNRVIDVIPLPYTRGVTFKHAFAILDEAQNCTKEEIKLFLTRIGEKTNVALCGDPVQNDLPKHIESGLVDFVNRIKSEDGPIGVTKFTVDDVVRDPVVQDVLRLYS